MSDGDECSPGAPTGERRELPKKLYEKDLSRDDAEIFVTGKAAFRECIELYTAGMPTQPGIKRSSQTGQRLFVQLLREKGVERIMSGSVRIMVHHLA